MFNAKISDFCKLNDFQVKREEYIYMDLASYIILMSGELEKELVGVIQNEGIIADDK